MDHVTINIPDIETPPTKEEIIDGLVVGLIDEVEEAVQTSGDKLMVLEEAGLTEEQFDELMKDPGAMTLRQFAALSLATGVIEYEDEEDGEDD